MKRTFLLLILTFLLSPVFSQQGKLIEAKLINSRSYTDVLGDLQILAAQYGVQVDLLAQILLHQELGVDVYRLSYYTRDALSFGSGSENLVKASGAVFIPKSSTKASPLTVYMHGTQTSDCEAPSWVADENYASLCGESTKKSEEEISVDQTLFGWLLAADGFINLMPDYPGLGDGEGFHPYLHAKTEAWAGIDMLTAFKEAVANEEIPGIEYTDDLYISGYSQGGHAAVAMQKEIESAELSYNIKLNIAGSGPYCLSEVQKPYLTDHPEFQSPVLIPYLALGFSSAYSDFYSEDEIFAAEFIDDAGTDIPDLYNRTYSTAQINSYLTTELGISDWRDMFVPPFSTDIEIDDCVDCPPVIKAMKDNDLVDWVPQGKLKLLFCFGDEVVASDNTLAAFLIFRLKEAPDVNAYTLGEASHLACGAPAVVVSKILMDSEAQQANLKKAAHALADIPSGNDKTEFLKTLMSNFFITFDEVKIDFALENIGEYGEAAIIAEGLEEEYNALKTVGIEANPYSGALTVYPVPATDFLTVELSGGISVGDIEIFDLTGKRILDFSGSGQTGPQSISLAGIERGAYLLKVEGAPGAIRKIILK